MRRLLAVTLFAAGCAPAFPSEPAVCLAPGEPVRCGSPDDPSSIAEGWMWATSCGPAEYTCADAGIATPSTVGATAVRCPATGEPTCEDGEVVVCFRQPLPGGPLDPCNPCEAMGADFWEDCR